MLGLPASLGLPFNPTRSTFGLEVAHVGNARHNAHRFVHCALDAVNAIVVDGENASTQVGACIPKVRECLCLGLEFIHGQDSLQLGEWPMSVQN